MLQLDEKQHDVQISNRMEEALLVEKEKLRMKIRQQVQREYQDLIHTLQDKLREQSQQVQELRQARLEIERLKRERDERVYLAKEEIKGSATDIFPPAPRSLRSRGF